MFGTQTAQNQIRLSRIPEAGICRVELRSVDIILGAPVHVSPELQRPLAQKSVFATEGVDLKLDTYVG